ncbi:hypothetical protein QN395_05460 [Undibacterium sp. RTI2.2]|uniref:hypothetical protein n=1 Tax=unclassified Undibacterium TaxID=2630295 RepID=UPI002AB49D64|nr:MULTISPECIES: hypothetical protein [unclassified Undibacterium]MDY7539759.1 hypothetical protein [Undibacterium sp. 5I1]MEB0115926.1 hypothetical protein [Undibacterium sp. RTI2.2]MEB0232424.1 hypothetical protein [Undibacterium sp. 10I3]MEB0256794.1 hypothetical protein [Undibacterium sp. 5I1]
MATINNFNSTVSNQIIGNQTNTNLVKDNNDLILEKLELILKKIDADSEVTKSQAIKASIAISDIKRSIESKDKDKTIIDRSLANLGSIATIGSFVQQISSLINQ